MRTKMTIATFSILLLLLFTSSSFAKEIEEDADSKIKVVKVKKDVPASQKTLSTKINPVTKTDIQNVIVPIIETESQDKALQSQSSSMAGEQINWQVISSGGGIGTSTNFMLTSSIGQIASGFSTSTNFILNSGFLQTFGPQGCCIGTRGNVDNDPGDAVDISDLVFIVDFIFTGGAAPVCAEEANVDGDVGEAIDISDLVYIVDFIFTGGAPPPSCP